MATRVQMNACLQKQHQPPLFTGILQSGPGIPFCVRSQNLDFYS